LDLHDGDVVVNCSGIINKRDDILASGGNELFLRESIIVNSVFPQLMAQWCLTKGVRFVHISTDCVYDGSKGSYTSQDKHTATDIYGITKSCGEPSDEVCILIRTSIIGESKNKRSLVEWLRTQQGKIITGYVNHKWNGVTCLELAKQIYAILSTKVTRGRFIVTSPVPVTKYQLCTSIADAYGWDINIVLGNDTRDVDRTLIGNAVSDKTISEQIKEMVEYSL
jgi:dTDP-4-dehydrorhamnose reductase